MKTHIFSIVLIYLLFSQMIYAQKSVTFDTKYRITPNGKLASENITFDFQTEEGVLYFEDKDLDYKKEYYIEFHSTMYDEGDYFNIVFGTNVAEHLINRKPKNEQGLFAIFYDEKNGEILGVRMIFVTDSDNTHVYLTEKGASLYKD